MTAMLAAGVAGAGLGAAVGGINALLARWGSLPRRLPAPVAIGGPALAVAVAYAAVAARQPLGPDAWLALAWIPVLAQVAFFDLEHQLILDVVTAPAALLAVAAAVFVPGHQLAWALVGGAGAAAFFGAVYAGARLYYGQEAFGLGDVKLAVVVGLVLGAAPPAVPAMTALLDGLVLASVCAIALMVSGRLGVRSALPLGPFLAAGAVLVMGLPAFSAAGLVARLVGAE